MAIGISPETEDFSGGLVKCQSLRRAAIGLQELQTPSRLKMRKNFHARHFSCGHRC